MPQLLKDIKNFVLGLVNSVEDTSIPAGAVSDASNWLTNGDKMMLRRGMFRVGAENTGSGRITGLHISHDWSGAEKAVYKTYAQKLKYTTLLTPATAVWNEIGSNQLGSAADNEDVSFAEYITLSGAQLWLNSPNCAGYYKIMTANPADVVDQYDSAKNYKGYIKIKQNRSWLWQRIADAAGVYGSYIDTQTYTTVSGESLGTGNASTLLFAGTLAFKAGGAKRTCFGITIAAVVVGGGTETFTDDYKGTLTSNLGGTGTINYATGAYSVTFNTAPDTGQAVSAGYQWENSTNNGIADFTKSATRTAGQGFLFRQDQGGKVQRILSFKDVEYCFHELMIWAINLTNTDTAATNLIHRDNSGIPNKRAAVETGDGVYYIDDKDQKDPKFRLMTYDQAGAAQVVPIPISNNIDLSNYRFDRGVSFEYGNYILFGCRHKDSTYNNATFVYNKVWRSFDRTDYRISCHCLVTGALWVGDSMSNNVFELFSGLDDDGSVIDNYLIFKNDDLDIQGIKKNKRLVTRGEIGPDQSIEIYASVDNGKFVLVDTIAGSGSYVDKGQKVTVGSLTLGRGEVGGGGDGITAYKFTKESTLSFGQFELIKIKYVATDIGWAAISRYSHKDIRPMRRKIARKYR